MSNFEIPVEVVKHMRDTAKRIIAIYHLDCGEFDDLVQEMKIEMWKVLPKYDPTQNTQMTTFLSRIIDTYALRRGSDEKQRRERGLRFLSLDAMLAADAGDMDCHGVQRTPRNDDRVDRHCKHSEAIRRLTTEHDLYEEVARRDDYRLLRMAIALQKEPYRRLGEVCLTQNLFATQLARHLGIKWSTFSSHTWRTFLLRLRQTIYGLLRQATKQKNKNKERKQQNEHTVNPSLARVFSQMPGVLCAHHEWRG